MEAFSNPRIYVGTYQKYNNGSTAGKWVDLTDYSDKKDFIKACKKIHKDEKEPEFMFQDFENFPKMFYSECGLSDSLFEYLDVVSSLDSNQIEPFNAFITNICGTWGYKNDMKSAFEDSFQGDFSSTFGDAEINFTNSYVDENVLQEIPEHLQTYFDYEQYSRMLFSTNYTSVGDFVFYVQ